MTFENNEHTHKTNNSWNVKFFFCFFFFFFFFFFFVGGVCVCVCGGGVGLTRLASFGKMRPHSMTISSMF